MHINSNIADARFHWCVCILNISLYCFGFWLCVAVLFLVKYAKNTGLSPILCLKSLKTAEICGFLLFVGLLVFCNGLWGCFKLKK